jgi:2-polyprenyl-3-methyl-5-hydroxy-6-metoxy-1,4-benzoquinol methylase
LQARLKAVRIPSLRGKLRSRLSRRPKTLVAAGDLDRFVAHSDELGGPGHPDCERYWQTVTYFPGQAFSSRLDPFSEDYVARQLSLYREISGRVFEQQANEMAHVDVDVHAGAPNPYAHWPPERLALHMERLSRAIRLATPPEGGRLLDMGCGWGLSSELAAYCGLKVTCVDINPDFVALVNRRASRLGLDIKAVAGAFDSFDSGETFDTILFYECFHHALRPWALAARMASLLKPGGALVLAGEPINDFWWNDWGLRLDPLSIYCMRKFGWLESGWSAKFLRKCLSRAGLQVQLHRRAEPETAYIVIGRRPLSAR